MKFKHKTKRIINAETSVVEKKINTYLLENSYRIIERGPKYVIFTEDEFSDRKRSRSDFHTRIGEGKFLFAEKTDGGACVELIYFTSMSYYIVIVMLVCAFGIYTNNIIMPIVFSIVSASPILYKLMYLNMHVFKEIFEC